MKTKLNYKLIACFLIGIGSGLRGIAQETQLTGADHPLVDNSFNGTAWALGLLLMFAVAFLFYTLGKFSSLGVAGRQ